jgi:hypothetical protein
MLRCSTGGAVNHMGAKTMHCNNLTFWMTAALASTCLTPVLAAPVVIGTPLQYTDHDGPTLSAFRSG